MTDEYFHRFLESHKARFPYIDEIPEKPLEWVRQSLEGMDGAFLALTILDLTARGACVADCVRYATGHPVDLPFLGAERQVFDIAIAGMHAQGIEPSATVALIGAIVEAVTTYPIPEGFHICMSRPRNHPSR
jgi:hypothetical protein